MNDAEVRMQVKADDGGGFVKLGNNIKACDKQAEFLKIKINDLKVGIQQMESTPKKFGKTEIAQAKSELEKLENQYGKLTTVQEVSSQSLEKNMDKGVSSLKKFAFSLVGIQSIWRAVSKASSAYMGENQDLANKMQAAWIGLGSMLAPILEWVANTVIKIVSYINAFLTGLFGINLLAKATAKSMAKIGKASKEATANMGIDELATVNKNDGVGGFDSNWADAFKDVQLNEKLAERLRLLGGKIRNVWDEVGKIILAVLLIVAIAIAIAVGSWLLAFALIVAFFVIFWKEIKAVTLFVVEVIKAIIISLWELFKGIIELGISLVKSAVSVIVGFITYGVSLIIGIFGSITSSVMGVVEGVKTIFKGIITFISGVFAGDWKRAWEGIKMIFKGVFDTLWSIVKLPLNLMINGFNALIKGLNKISFDVPSWIPLIGGNKWGFNIKTIPQLAVGTNYVGSDGLAFLHKGEAVIPEKFNSQEYFNKGESNVEQTKLLTEQNELLRGLLRKNTDVIIDGRVAMQSVENAQRNRGYQTGSEVFSNEW